MNEITFSCKCGQRIVADETMFGQVWGCPACGEDVAIPAIAPATACPTSAVEDATPQYFYIDLSKNKRVGPVTTTQLAEAWSQRRINKKSILESAADGQSIPLTQIPQYEQLKQEKNNIIGCGITLLIIIAAILAAAALNPSKPASKLDMERERNAKEWLSDPGTRKFFNEWNRQQRNDK